MLNRRCFLTIALLLTTGFWPSFALANKSCEGLLKPLLLFETDLSDPELPFRGMTELGYQRLIKAQTDLKAVTTHFNNVFESMESMFDIYMIAMASGHNVMSTGGPGGAKSASLLWLISNLWVKQVHEMLTDMSLIGGQTAEGLKRGVEVINTSGSLIEAAFAMLDEVNNANPQMLATVLSLMNPGERFIYVNGKRIMSKLRSMFTTSNASRYEMVQMFKERGMQSGDAFLNRSLFKLLVPNWLELDQQIRRDHVNRRRQHLRSLVKYGTNEAAKIATAEMKPFETREIDWEVVDAFAEQAFEASDDLESAARDFANQFRQRIHREMKDSERAQREQNGRSSVLTPSAEWTERLRSEVLRVIKYSVALDYLRVADPKELTAARFNKPLVLGPLSLWRVQNIATTVGPGLTRLNLKSLEVEFNLIRDGDGGWTQANQRDWVAGTKDFRTQAEYEHMFLEQKIFNEIFNNLVNLMKEEAKSVAALLNEDPDSVLLESSEIERLISTRQRGR